VVYEVMGRAHERRGVVWGDGKGAWATGRCMRWWEGPVRV